MTWFDYALLLVLVISVLAGLFRGLVREVLSLAAWIAAFLLSLRFASSVDHRLAGWIVSPVVRSIVAYASVFLAVLIIGTLITWLIVRLIRGVGLGGLDRSLGALFGFLRGLFILVAGVLLIGGTAVRAERWWQSSLLVPQLEPWAAELRHWIPERWLDYLRPPERGPHPVSGA